MKDARYSKLKNILFLLSDEKEGQIIENIDFKYLSHLWGNPVEMLLHWLLYPPVRMSWSRG